MKPRKTYHHPDLRRALLDAAIAWLRTGDVTGLTMQALARTAGVSPGAPYHHFPDKVSLLAALATEGFELWLARATTIVETARSPERKLEALSLAWLDFAATHVAHYRVMFLPDVEDRVRFAVLHETSGKSLALLVGVLAEGLPGAPQRVLLGRAVTAFATMHGFAALANAGVLTNIPSLPRLSTLQRQAAGQVVAAALSPFDRD